MTFCGALRIPFLVQQVSCDFRNINSLCLNNITRCRRSIFKFGCSQIQPTLQLKCLSTSSTAFFNASDSFNTSKKMRKSLLKDDSNVLFELYSKRKRASEKTKSFLQKFSAQSLVHRTSDNVKPYLQLLRADKPIGTLLLYFPCVFSICLATPPGEFPSLYYLGLFGVGSFLMRGAGCIINDLWDKDLDSKVERTKDRPIASGKVTVNNAIKLLAGNLTLSLAILLSLNSTCIVMGIASMLPVILYPLAKRYTWYPQVVLGFTFNIGALMGYTAVIGELNWPVLGTLYASCIFWTILYDTIYAFQDVKDDEVAGIKSTALLFSKYTPEEIREMIVVDRLKEQNDKKLKIAVFLWFIASTHMTLFIISGLLSNLNGMFYLATFASIGNMAEQLLMLDTNSRDSCWNVFENNKWHALILVFGIVLAVKSKPKDRKQLVHK